MGVLAAPGESAEVPLDVHSDPDEEVELAESDDAERLRRTAESFVLVRLVAKSSGASDGADRGGRSVTGSEVVVIVAVVVVLVVTAVVAVAVLSILLLRRFVAFVFRRG